MAEFHLPFCETLDAHNKVVSQVRQHISEQVTTNDDWPDTKITLDISKLQVSSNSSDCRVSRRHDSLIIRTAEFNLYGSKEICGYLSAYVKPDYEKGEVFEYLYAAFMDGTTIEAYTLDNNRDHTQIIINAEHVGHISSTWEELWGNDSREAWKFYYPKDKLWGNAKTGAYLFFNKKYFDHVVTFESINIHLEQGGELPIRLDTGCKFNDILKTIFFRFGRGFFNQVQDGYLLIPLYIDNLPKGRDLAFYLASMLIFKFLFFTMTYHDNIS